jgi:hypothetical protein
MLLDTVRKVIFHIGLSCGETHEDSVDHAAYWKVARLEKTIETRRREYKTYIAALQSALQSSSFVQDHAKSTPLKAWNYSSGERSAQPK